MSLVLKSSVTAMSPGLTTSVVGQGGVEPYTYSVLSGDGSIDSDGVYTAPLVMNPDPKLANVVLQVEDDDGVTATCSILVTDALGLFCEILQKELGLASGRVYLWDQKIPQPTDSGLYVAVSVPNCKPFANTNKQASSGGGLDSIQSLNMMAQLTIDIISRGPEARTRKEEVLMALASNYAQSQQELNSFNIGKLPAAAQFVNLSLVDGAAIPYRYNISVNMQYFVRKIKAVPYFDEFVSPQVTTES